MPVFDTWLKRRKRELGQQPDTYCYGSLPPEFRVQVVHICLSTIGHWYLVRRSPLEQCLGAGPDPPSNEAWKWLHDSLARELGRFSLGDEHQDPCTQYQQYLLSADTDGALTAIQHAFWCIDKILRTLPAYATGKAGASQTPDDAIDELNQRFQEHSLGYQFEEGKLHRLDSELVHAEVVRPALALLQDPAFRGAEAEFLSAHGHYRKGEYKQAVNEALKAFESAMKCICHLHRWQYSPKATAADLIEVIFQHGLIPPELTSHLTALRSTLESGLPTLRNRMAAHGQGPRSVDMPEYLAAYALHLAASNIVLIVEAHKARR